MRTTLVDRVAPTETIPAVHGDVKDPLLLIRDLNAGYGKTQVLFGVDMHVERGEIVALLGTNGAGKSTLLSVISGLLEPSDGQVIFDGQDIAGRTPQETLAAGVVFMPGGKGVFPTLTVEENFKLAAWQFQKDTGARRRRCSSAASVTSRSSKNGGIRRPATCPAASSRCSRSAKR